MLALLSPWLQFAVCAVMIGFAGSALTRYGEEVSELTGLSRSWIGIVMLATATSLPELFTGLSAITLADAPNIALGDALGSCILNLALLVLLDALVRHEPVYSRIHQGHIMTAAFGVILIGLVGTMIIVLPQHFNIMIGHVSLFTLLIILVYLFAMRATFVVERRDAPLPVVDTFPQSGRGLRGVLLRYAVAASVVALAGGYLPFVGMQIAEQTGWQTSFVGTLLIAAATSLPEVAVMIAAYRRNAVDMAIASLLGSNLFDMLVIALDDIAYTKGFLLSAVSPAHAASAFAGVTMSGIFIVALLYRPRNVVLGAISWISLSLLAVYIFSAYFVYLQG